MDINYNEIKVLKRGQSGFGYLIEHDAGYISPDEPRNQPFINEIKKLDSGSKLAIMEPLIVYVVLQKFDILNRNGRIYPKAILVKQNELYQEAIPVTPPLNMAAERKVDSLPDVSPKNVETTIREEKAALAMRPVPAPLPYLLLPSQCQPTFTFAYSLHLSQCKVREW